MTSYGETHHATAFHHFSLSRLLALLYVVLGLQVSRLRQGNKVLFGDGGNIKLRSAIRAHANFVEYVPLIVLMVAMLEMSGMPAPRVHLLMAALLVARLLHPLGMYVGSAIPAVSDLPGRRHFAHLAGHARLRLAPAMEVSARRNLILPAAKYL